MITLNLKQGTPEWLAARAQHFTASEAPAAMGLSKYQTRTALLAQKKTGIAADIAPATQALFDRGHAAEATARAIAEGIIGEDLFPCTGSAEVEGLPLLASFDGLTMAEDVNFEHKLYNAGLADFIDENDDLPETHWPQVEHQMLVSGATRTLFMVSDGTENNCAWIWYESKPERRAALIASWKQFAADLAEFVPQAAAPQVVAAPVESLPAVFVQVTGSLAVTDNLQKFGDALQSFVARINTKPENDQDFADCESAIKTLSRAEEALDAAESAALAQVECLDTMRMLKTTLKDLARNNRLSLEKLVKAEKENRRIKIITDAQQALAAHFIGLRCEYVPNVFADFSGAAKGLKSIDSMRDKVATELARCKSVLTESALKINQAQATIADMGKGFEFLFADRAILVLKAPEDLAAVIANRITAHKVEELAKEEALREKIRSEELVKKFAAENAAKHAELQAQAKAEQEAREAKNQEWRDAEPTLPSPSATPMPTANITPAIMSALDTGARITLGAINARLSPISLTREGLASLGFTHVERDKAAYLFRESDFPSICAALIDHVGRAANGLKVAA
jgi:putative phage-type endonuclease